MNQGVLKLPKMLPFSLEEIEKDIGVKMSKRKSTNSALSFDDVLNHINDTEKMVKLVIILMNCAVKKKKLIIT